MEQFNLVPKFSLQEMALKRVVVNLWCDPNIKSQKAKLSFPYLSISEFDQIVNLIKEKVKKLVLPNSLVEKMMPLVKPIGIEINEWIADHENILDRLAVLGIDILKTLCWTFSYAIDDRKTAELIVQLDSLDIATRYKLACKYCLEDYIPVLWRRLPERYKSRLNGKSNFENKSYPLQYYWTCIQKEEELDMNNILSSVFISPSTDQSLFQYSVYMGNKVATEYFLQKLKAEEKNGVLIGVLCSHFFFEKSLKSRRRSCVLFPFLFLITHEQQMQFLRENPLKFLLYFLDWSWKDMFLNFPVQIWNFLPEEVYEKALEILNSRMFKYVASYYLPELFQKIFISSPINFRKSLVNYGSRNIDFLSEFLRVEDGETIKVVLENIGASDRRKILGNALFCDRIAQHVFADRWHLVELCVGEDTLSAEERSILRRYYQKIPASQCEYWKRIRKVDAYTRRSVLCSDMFYNHVTEHVLTDKWQMVELCVGVDILNKEEGEILQEILNRIYKKFPANSCKKWKRFWKLLNGKTGYTDSESSEDEMLSEAKRLKTKD